MLLAWNRWRRESIDKSAGQLHGAERWIRNNPLQIYLDPNCKKQFPLLDGNINDYDIHLVAITKNSHEPAKNHFGGGSSGSFMLMPFLSDEEVKKKPFILNDLVPNKTYVHVFDEFTLDLSFQELDTVSVFCPICLQKRV